MENETDGPTIYGRVTDGAGRVWERLTPFGVPPGTILPGETFRGWEQSVLVWSVPGAATFVNAPDFRRRLDAPPGEPVIGISEATFRQVNGGWRREG